MSDEKSNGIDLTKLCVCCGTHTNTIGKLFEVKSLGGSACGECMSKNINALLEPRLRSDFIKHLIRAEQQAAIAGEDVGEARGYIRIEQGFLSYPEFVQVQGLFGEMVREAGRQRIKWGLAHDMSYTRADWTSLFCKLAADLWLVRKHDVIEQTIYRLGATVISCWLALWHHRQNAAAKTPEAPPRPLVKVEDVQVGGDVESVLRQQAADHVAQVELERFLSARSVTPPDLVTSDKASGVDSSTKEET